MSWIKEVGALAIALVAVFVCMMAGLVADTDLPKWVGPTMYAFVYICLYLIIRLAFKEEG